MRPENLKYLRRISEELLSDSKEKGKCSSAQLIILKCWEKYRITRWLLTSRKGLFVLNLGTHLDWRIYRSLNLLLSPRWPASSSIPAFILAPLKTFLLLFQFLLILRLWDRYKPNISQRCHQHPVLSSALKHLFIFVTDKDLFILPAN